MPQKTILENGLRVVTESMPQMQSVTTALFVATGSRYEDPALNGISHFLEHMVFKGSVKRPDQLAIARSIEGVGGHLNGFTHQEATAFYTVTLADHFALAADVLFDMLLQPLLDPEKLAMERGVVIQEIRTRKDVPQSWVHQMLQSALWQDQPLGWPVAGTEEVVSQLNAEVCRSYLADWYHPRNMVFAAAGNIEHEQAVDLAREHLGAPKEGRDRESVPAAAARTGPAVTVETRSCEEVHFCVGFRGYPRRHPLEYPLYVLDTILGSGMSSRLFQEIREKRGLAYSVGAYPRFFQDTGAWVVYASVDPEKPDEALGAVVEELRRMRDESLDESELAQAKEFLKGSLLLSLESTSSFAMMLGERELLTGSLVTPEEIRSRIEAVTAEQVCQVAQETFRAASATLAVVGPVPEDATARFSSGIAGIG